MASRLTARFALPCASEAEVLGVNGSRPRASRCRSKPVTP